MIISSRAELISEDIVRLSLRGLKFSWVGMKVVPLLSRLVTSSGSCVSVKLWILLVDCSLIRSCSSWIFRADTVCW